MNDHETHVRHGMAGHEGASHVGESSVQSPGQSMSPPPFQLTASPVQEGVVEENESLESDLGMGGGFVGAQPPGEGSGAVQRKPEEAMEEGAKKKGTGPTDTLKTVLANAKRIEQEFPLVKPGGDSWKALQQEIGRHAKDWLKGASKEDQSDLEDLWNKGLDNKDVAVLWEGFGGKAEYTKSKAPEEITDLAKWYKRSQSKKTMTPDKKMAQLLVELLPEENWPEDVVVALKLFFAHTADFVPEGKVGRDYRQDHSGDYYRSSNDAIRSANTELIKEKHEEGVGKLKKKKKKGNKPTAQVLNKGLVEHMNKKEMLGNKDMERHDLEGDEELGYYTYTADQSMQTGAFGMVSNVYRTVRTGTRLAEEGLAEEEETVEDEMLDNEEEEQEEMKGGGFEEEEEEDVEIVKGLEEADLVDEDFLELENDSGENYHDALLKDRAQLVQEISNEIMAENKKMQSGIQFLPIQSAEHPSLILELTYPPSKEPLKDREKLSEMELREDFITAFNSTAEAQNINTRVTHRGSFGHPMPTASSVGGPVRVWPGLAPKSLFKQLVRGALEIISTVAPDKSSKNGQDYWKQEKDLSFDPLKFKSKKDKEQESSPIHVDALRMAVRFAQSMAAGEQELYGPKALYNWLLNRLKRNLQKAKFLLSLKPVDQGSDQHYVKSVDVIENLMEYSMVLQSLLPWPEQDSENDPYETYFEEVMEMGLNEEEEDEQRTFYTFYLDSGMQALGSAGLVARAWHSNENMEEEEDAQPQMAKPQVAGKKGKFDSTDVALDIHSYFEFAMIDSAKLKVITANRKSDKALGQVYDQDPEGIVAQLSADVPPGIIAADLNPVLTSSYNRKHQQDPSMVLGKFAGKKGLNKLTIPIVDVTNQGLNAAAVLKLHEGYQNFIVVESLSKHQQLGADKFTMGRLVAVGCQDFLDLAREILQPIADAAHDPMTEAYSYRMDQIFYGKAEEEEEEEYDETGNFEEEEEESHSEENEKETRFSGFKTRAEYRGFGEPTGGQKKKRI